MKNQLRKLTSLCIWLMAISLANAQTPVSNHGPLSVNGNQIVDQNGAALSLAGNSFFWSNTGWGAESFYNPQIINWLKTDWNSAIVRAAMGVEENGGYLTDPTGNKDRVKAVVDAAIAEGLYVLIDWHSHHAEDYQQESITFFQEMATLYGGYDHVIYEIYNEPTYSNWTNDIKPYAVAVISAIRAIDPDNLIVVGSSNWSQDVDIASQNPITGYSNIAYSLHFYAGTHGQYLRNKANTAMSNGIAIMVTEYGTVNADGDGAVATQATNEWMNWMEQNNLTHLNWSVHDKDEGASIVYPGSSPTGGWSSNNLTPSGTLVRQIMLDWNDAPTGGTDQLNVSNSTVSLDETASSTTINVTANINWTASSSQNWISVSPTSGSGNGSINISVSANTSTNPRSGTLTVTGGSLSRTISINQDGEDNTGGGETCDNPNAASLPYAHDGSGNFCLEIEGTIGHVNSWNTELVEINGVNYTNNWSNSMPPRINGKYYVRYIGNFNWSHLEFSGTNARVNSISELANAQDVILYPNPARGKVKINNLNDYERITVSNLSGKVLVAQTVTETNATLNLEQLSAGTYLVTVTGSAANQHIFKLIVD